MASQARLGAVLLTLQWALYLVFLSLPQHANAQVAVCMNATEQPVVISIDPPSGTTGTDNTRSTNYTITGERLDQVADVMVQYDNGFVTIRLSDIEQEPTQIRFHLTEVPLPRLAGTLTEVILLPNKTQCSQVSLTISLHDTGKNKWHAILVVLSSETVLGVSISQCVYNVGLLYIKNGLLFQH